MIEFWNPHEWENKFQGVGSLGIGDKPSFSGLAKGRNPDLKRRSRHWRERFKNCNHHISKAWMECPGCKAFGEKDWA